MKTLGQIIAVVLTGIGFLSVVLFGWSLIMALPVKWLWNYVCPTLFHLPEIVYSQAFCLLLLTGLLFKANITKKESKD